MIQFTNFQVPVKVLSAQLLFILFVSYGKGKQTVSVV
jgi:hypothetical protein